MCVCVYIYIIKNIKNNLSYKIIRFVGCTSVALKHSYVLTQRDNVIAHPIVPANAARAKRNTQRGNAPRVPSRSGASLFTSPSRLEFIYYSRE